MTELQFVRRTVREVGTPFSFTALAFGGGGRKGPGGGGGWVLGRQTYGGCGGGNGGGGGGQIVVSGLPMQPLHPQQRSSVLQWCFAALHQCWHGPSGGAGLAPLSCNLALFASRSAFAIAACASSAAFAAAAFASSAALLAFTGSLAMQILH